MSNLFYFSLTDDNNQEVLIKKLYGKLINIISFKPWERTNSFATGSILYVNSISDFYDGKIDISIYDESKKNPYFGNIAAEICDHYLQLYREHVVIRFEKTPNCNSEHIEEIINLAKLTHNWNDFASILKEEIKGYWFQEAFYYRARSARIKNAQENGAKVGLQKGTKLVTEKSVIAKTQILIHSKDFGGDMSDIELMRKLNISRNAFYKYKKEAKIANDNKATIKAIDLPGFKEKMERDKNTSK